VTLVTLVVLVVLVVLVMLVKLRNACYAELSVRKMLIERVLSPWMISACIAYATSLIAVDRLFCNSTGSLLLSSELPASLSALYAVPCCCF
jgi:hypothetical protein